MNSIIFEGTIKGSPVFIGEGKSRRCSLIVVSWSYVYRKNGDAVRKKETPMRVEFSSEDLVDAAKRLARRGRDVKVVGKMAGSAIDALYLEAEHMEYRSGLYKVRQED
jgi:hypothetical protein